MRRLHPGLCQDRLSTIIFSVRKSRGWDPDANATEHQPTRHADVYVFALLAQTDQGDVDPLELSQWEFYVPPTWRLDERERSQHSIPLPSLRAMTSALPWAGLDGAVRVAADSQRQSQSARTPDEAPRV